MSARSCTLRHCEAMSATDTDELSSTRIFTSVSFEQASDSLPHSPSVICPVMTFFSGTMLTPDIRREASCSRCISREKTATGRPVDAATCRAMFIAIEVLPMPGRDATSTSSPEPRPRILSSMSARPV